MTIDISGLDKAEVLMALHNGARPRALHGGYPESPMGRDEAETLIGQDNYFGYVNGRALHVDIGGALLSHAMYDNNNGSNAAARALAPLIAAKLQRGAPEDPEGDRKFAEAVGAMAGLTK